MLLGVLPSEQLLSQYRLTEYADIAAAMRTGDVGLLMRCMDANQLAFVQVRLPASCVAYCLFSCCWNAVLTRSHNAAPINQRGCYLS